MTIDQKIVTWVHDHLDELEWFEGAQGGTVCRYNNISIHVSMAGLVLSDGIKSCRVAVRDVKKLLDTNDYTDKDIFDKVAAIRAKAVGQIIDRLEDSNGKERIKRELFGRLAAGGF